MIAKKITFEEKLQIISEIYFENHKPSFAESELVIIENNLRITIPLTVRMFYIMFGGDSDLLKAMYDIATPRELYMEKGVLMVAKDSQNACRYGISIDTQQPIYLFIYFDDSNNVVQIIDQNIEDFFIYLLAIQGTEYFPCVGKIDTEFTAKLVKCLPQISKRN